MQHVMPSARRLPDELPAENVYSRSEAMHPRPLVVRFGALGDMVILLGMIAALHQRFRVPVDVVASCDWMRPLLESQPGIGRLHMIRSRRAPYLLSPGQRELVATLRAREPGPIWLCQEDSKSRWLLARAGIPESHLIDMRSWPRRPGEHALEHLQRLARLSPAAFEESADSQPEFQPPQFPSLVISPAWRTELDDWLERCGLQGRAMILIQAGNRRTAKRSSWRQRPNDKHWPPERWAGVIDGVAEMEPEAEILLIGVANERGMNRHILDAVRTRRVRNVAGDLPLTRLVALQERAVGMISVDTGPAHTAAAAGCPVVALFGTADPCMYAPRGRAIPVVCLTGQVDGRQSILGITEDQVIAAWKALISSSQQPTGTTTSRAGSPASGLESKPRMRAD